MTIKDSLQTTEKSPSIRNSSNKYQEVSELRKDSQMKAIDNEKGRSKYIWLIIATMSIIIFFIAAFFMAFPEITYDVSDLPPLFGPLLMLDASPETASGQRSMSLALVVCSPGNCAA